MKNITFVLIYPSYILDMVILFVSYISRRIDTPGLKFGDHIDEVIRPMSRTGFCLVFVFISIYCLLLLL